MKKKLSLLLAAAMTLSLMAGCVKQIPPPAEPAPPQEPEVVEPAPETPEQPETPADVDPVDFAVISGPTGVGAAKLLTQIEKGEAQQLYNFSIAASNDNRRSLRQASGNRCLGSHLSRDECGWVQVRKLVR